MKINTEELEETIIPVKETDLIYGIDDRPPLKETLFAALQHLLAIFVAIISKQPVFWCRWLFLLPVCRPSYNVSGLVR